MSVGHEHHSRVSVAIAVALGRFHEPLDLGFGQVFAGSQLAVGGRLGVTVRFTMAGVTGFRCALAIVFGLIAGLTVHITRVL